MRLPFPMPPAIQAYLHHAYTTGVVEGLGHPWALSNEYINLEVRVNDRYSGTSLFMDITPWTDLAAFEQQGLCLTVTRSAEEIASMPATHLAATLRKLLVEGRYVEAYVDEYFIPPSAHFRSKHQNHALLVVGFDDSTGSFDAVIYNKEGRFVISKIEAEILCHAIAMQPRLNAPYTADKALREIGRGSVSAEPGLDLKRIRDGLTGFLSPRNSLIFDEAWLDRVDTGTTGFVYGHLCYEYVGAGIRRAYERGGAIDLRQTRLIWERVKIGVRRVRQLAEAEIVPGEVESEWRRLAGCLHRVHLMAFQHNLDRQRGRAIRRESALPVLHAAITLERGLTERVVAAINSV